MPNTLNQPYIALLFFAGGALAFFFYRLFGLLPLLVKKKFVVIITDFFSVVAAGLIFITVCHFFNSGILLVYEFISFIVGFFATKALFRHTKNPFKANRPDI